MAKYLRWHKSTCEALAYPVLLALQKIKERMGEDQEIPEMELHRVRKYVKSHEDNGLHAAGTADTTSGGRASDIHSKHWSYRSLPAKKSYIS